MFRSSRRYFKLLYFTSSLVPVYLLLILFMTVIKIESDEKDCRPDYMICWCIVFILLICSICCLLRIKYMLEDIKKNYSKTSGFAEVKINYEYNVGSRDFIMSFILPLMSSFSVNEYPLATIMMVLLVQFLVYLIYINSSDFFPNISLILAKYSVCRVDNTGVQGNIQYVFVQTKKIDNLLGKKTKICPIGEPGRYNDIGLVI